MPDCPATLPKEQPTLRLVPMPADLNPHGDVFGGWVMSQVDIAGGIAAIRRARGRVVTVAVNAFLFKQPISVGDLVSIYTKIIKTGQTSLTVNVEVFAQRNPETPITVKVTEATLTYVAVDHHGEKRPLPPDDGQHDETPFSGISFTNRTSQGGRTP